MLNKSIFLGILFLFTYLNPLNVAHAQPWPPPYVPCDEVRPGLTNWDEGEFHSLRPYQASPCNQTLSELKLYCGNDIILEDRIEVKPSEGTCVEVSDDPQLYNCEFDLEREANFTVGLVDAELPILGNTQLVPNQVNDGDPQPEEFGWDRRVNEYLSWYLNGAPYKADEEYADPDEINIEYNHMHIEQYAGPLRKLLPLWIQWTRRAWESGDADEGDRRHNQIVLCTLGNQEPCWYNYTYDLNGPEVPPPGVPLFRHRIGDFTPESPYMLMSSTEDRLGQIYVDPSATVQPDQSYSVQLSDLEFDIERDSDILYFAHTEDVSKLAFLLQLTYIPITQFAGLFSFEPDEPRVAYNTYRCDLEDVRWNTGDDLFGEIAATNGPVTDPDTGSQVTGENITGTARYNVEFSCQFDSLGGSVGGNCYSECIATCIEPVDPENPTYLCSDYCNDECTEPEPTCEREALTAVSVYTRSPKMEEIWYRTVDSRASWVKRMYPRLGVNGMFEELKDFPAVTSATYTSTSEDVTTYAGKLENQRSGSDAEIFIPHLGGVYEFAMVTMQDMLRPRIMSTLYLRLGLPPGSGDQGAPGVGVCTTAPAGSACDPNTLAAYFLREVPGITADEALIRGTNASMICWRESRAIPSVVNNSCTYSHDGQDNDRDGCFDGNDYAGATNNAGSLCTPRVIAGTSYWFDGATVDLSVGLFQHNLLAVCAGLQEGVDWGWNNPPWCDIATCMPAPWCNLPESDPQIEDCIENYQDADFNILRMIERSSGGTNWSPWCTSNPAVNCGLCG